MTAFRVVDADRRHVTVDVDESGLVVVDTDQEEAVYLWPDDALGLAEYLTLAAMDAVRTPRTVAP